MKKILIISMCCLAISIFSISCGSLGGSSGVTVKAADVDKSFEPKTSIAYIGKQGDRPILYILLANFDFTQKDKGDIFRPKATGDPNNVVIKMEVMAAEGADSNNPFKLGETPLSKGKDSMQRVYSLNIRRLTKNATETIPIIKHKDATITLDSLTDDEVTGSFDFQSEVRNTDGSKDENAMAKGSFKAKIWKEDK